MSDKPQFETIDPATVELAQAPGAAPAARAGSGRGARLAVIAAGAVLVALMIGVFLVLPGLVERTTSEAVAPPPTAAPPAAQTPPLRQAELAQARREAQDILARLLEAQDTLEKKQVNLWAEDDFAAMNALAAQGDARYRQGAFDEALQLYKDARAKSEALLARATALVAEKNGEGGKALADMDQQRAEAAFRLVLAIDPDNTEARTGLARAGLLPQIRPLLENARGQVAEKRWGQAKGALDALLALDERHTEARHMLTQVEREIRAEEFNGFMGVGLVAMQRGDYRQAARQFEQALKVDPASEDARVSLNQARAALQAHDIAITLAAAQEQEAAEQWAQAAASYQQVLDADDSVVSARVGLLRSQARARLDDGIAAILADPLRLASGTVYTQASQLLRDAEQVSPRGARLETQITALRLALEKARQPVTVHLQSDNQTQVTLLRVGEMGAFSSRTIELRPGRYVVVGSRAGFRDVRVEFEVAADSAVSVTIACTERV
ncbi:MAG: tetratricopeptide repeat protein [Pseudomonas sp.]